MNAKQWYQRRVAITAGGHLYLHLFSLSIILMISIKMEIYLVAIILTVIGATIRSECPYECVDGVIPAYEGNDDLLCTTVLSKTLSSINCLKKCNVAVPTRLTLSWALINATCTTKTGCSQISDQFMKYAQCWEDEDGVATLAAQIVGDFNSNKEYEISCQFLRTAQYCLRTSVGSCGYLATIMTQQLDATPKYRTATAICGSEKVPKAPIKSFCSENVISSILEKCGVACLVASADSSEELCKALQRQSDCLVAESEGCSGSLETYLQPRIDSYAITNHFLKCNISVDGIVVKPPAPTQGRVKCDYRSVLKSCMLVETLDSVHHIFIRNLLNLDFPLDDFCKDDFELKSQMDKCSASLWSCVNPVGLTFKAPTNFDGSFYPDLGVFPFNKWGLQTIVNSCPYSPVKSTVLCRGSTHRPGKTTPSHFLRRTPPSIFKRPTPSRKPIIL